MFIRTGRTLDNRLRGLISNEVKRSKFAAAVTLVELMVVILITGILASVGVALVRGRIDSAKWTEGKTTMGSIASAIRAYAVEKNELGNYGDDLPTLNELGFIDTDFRGAYFGSSNFSWKTDFDKEGSPALTFTIQATNSGTGIISPHQVTLDQAGTWSVTP